MGRPRKLTPLEEMPYLLSPREAAPYLHRGERQVYEQAKAGLIPTVPRPDNRVMIARSTVMALIGMQAEPVAPPDPPKVDWQIIEQAARVVVEWGRRMGITVPAAPELTVHQGGKAAG